MAEAIVNFVAEKLGDLITNEAQLLGGVGEQVSRVQTELINIRCYLRDADSKQRKGDASVENWLNQLRKLAYRIEDTTDTFYLELEDDNGIEVEDDNNSSQKKRILSLGKVKKMGHMAKKLPDLRKLGRELGNIQKELKEIFKSKDKFGIKPLPHDDDRRSGQQRQEVRLPKRRVAYQDVDEGEVVGLDADINNILQQLRGREETPRRAVITIVGPGGIGKTTLARSVYNRVKADFEHHMMLSVSQQFSLIDLLRRILRNLLAKPEDPKIVDDVGYYVGELRRLLSQMRYLIILDDVWDDDVWEQLKDALLDDKNGSRVLMTSRSINVAKSADSGMKPYELAFLNDRESLHLLLKKALPYQEIGEECSSDLLELANALSKKCAGLPLALIVLGGILSTKNLTYHDWNKVFNTMDWHEEGKDCMRILAMSYEDMPFDLKPCFLYLASFPEDYEIYAKDLIKIWIAEGLIPQQEKKTMEEVAQIFLEQLFQRSMLSVSSRDVDGSIERCQVHDLIRDLAIREATNENFVTIFRNLKGFQSRHRGTRRASLQSDDGKECLKCVGPNNRTLLWFNQYRRESPKQFVEMVEFRLLKVLLIVKVKEIEIRGLDRLIHLKYLKISAQEIIFLPNDFSWGRLKNLQTLDISGLHKQIENGSPLEAMTSLWTIGTVRHAIFFSYRPDGPPPNADLRNLQTLGRIGVSRSWQKNQLPRLNNLRDLWICDLSESINWDGLAHLLGTLPHLLCLSIMTDNSIIPKEIVYPRGLPNYENLQTLNLYGRWPKDVTLDARLFPPHLLKLRLRFSQLGLDLMPELGKLKGLKELELGFNVYKGGKEMICPTGFPVLQTLELFDCEIKSFKVMEGVMPKLKHFRVMEAPYKPKVSMPSELRHLSN